MLSVANTAKAIVAGLVFTAVLLVTLRERFLAYRSSQTTWLELAIFRERDLMRRHQLVTTLAGTLAKRGWRRARNGRRARQLRAGGGNATERTFDELGCAETIGGRE